MNTFDLEPCKIMYAYPNDQFFCGKWFQNRENFISEDRKPNAEFINKYVQKGFNFNKNVFKPVSDIFMDANKYIF